MRKKINIYYGLCEECAKCIPPLFACKSLRKVCTLLLMLCVSVVSWAATRYCGETIQSTGENTSISVNVTIQKLNETTTRIILDNEHITGLRDGGCFQQWPGGVWKNNDNAPGVADFEIGWTQSGNKWQKDFEWATYPTTANIYFLMSLDNETSEPHGALFTLTDVDMSASCSGGGSTPESATIDWSAQSWITNGTDKFKILTVPAIEERFGVKQLLNNDICIPFPAAVFGACSLGELNEAYTIEGAQIKVPQSTFSQQETHFTMVCESTTYDIYVYNATASAGGGEGPTPAKVSECIGAKGDWSSPTEKKMYYQIDYADNKVVFTLRSLTEYALDYAEVQIAGFGNYAMNTDATGAYTYTINNPTLNNEWYIRFLFSDTNFEGNWMSAQTQDANDANIIYYKVGDGTFTATENENIALASAGSTVTASAPSNENAALAIDGKEKTRWETPASDPQWICVDFGARKAFNSVQLVHEGAYIKTYDIQVSDDGVNFFTIKHVSEILGDPFPNTQTIDLGGKYVAQYLRIYGTERGTGYGYSLWELRVMYNTTPVLTTYSASLPGKFCTIGADYQIAVTALDQLGNDFALTSEYAISPGSAGTITAAGVYTPAQQGDATITVSGGGKVATINVRNEVSANLAFGKTATAGYNNDNAYKANNADLGDRWGSDGATHYNNGANPDFQDWWYVDLGNEAIYDIAEIAIKWETARPNDYDIRVSTDLETWTTINAYNTYPASNNDGSLNYEYYNNFSNSVPCRYVGVWAREGYGTPSLQYGISMYDFQVFGLEHVDAGVNVESITLNHTSATIELGESLTLTASVAPVNATDKSITWSSNAESVATVVDGVITTHTAGTARITATANDGSDVSATCELTVEPITDKTWWGIQRSAEWIGDKLDMDVIWSITRNVNKTLTYKVYFGGDASGIGVKQVYDGVNGDNGWHSLTGYDDVNRAVSFTTEETYEKGAQLSSNPSSNPFFFFGGPRIDVPTTYRVGDSNERPSSSVESVEISHAAATVVKGETLQLSATVLPSFVENKSITWSSDNETVATVSNTGYVTAVAEGTAHITATSVADGTKSATCTVKVVGSITPATWYGYSTVSPLEGLTAYTYSITRGTDHKLTFTMTTDKNVVGYVSGIEGDVTGAFSGYDAENHTGTFTTAGTYTDGTELHLQLTFASESYGAPAYNFTYTVGFKNDPLPQAVAVDEEKDNSAILTTYDGRTVIGVLGRSFTAGNLYTLVLPFGVEAEQRAEKLPGQLTKLNNSYLKDNGDLRINFVDAEAVEAGVPYLYTPSADVTNPVFTGVTVSKDLHEPADGYAKYYGIYAPTTGEELKNIPNAYVLGSDQYLYAALVLQDDQTMKALRGYFVLDFSTSGANAPRARVIFNSQETEIATDISDVQSAPVQCTKVLRDGQLLIIRDGRTYNAQGQWIK